MITWKVGPVVYELALPPDSKVHTVFHVSLLRPAHGVEPANLPTPLPINDDFEMILKPEKVLTHRWKGVFLELLIQRRGHPTEESSWEDYDFLQKQFPAFHLEDNAVFERGDIDRYRITYHRRHKKGNT